MSQPDTAPATTNGQPGGAVCGGRTRQHNRSTPPPPPLTADIETIEEHVDLIPSSVEQHRARHVDLRRREIHFGITALACAFSVGRHTHTHTHTHTRARAQLSFHALF
jgi:hypothetical protein